MIGYAIIPFSIDPDGHFIFPLTGTITEMKGQIFFGMDFCEKQVAGAHFDLRRVKIKNCPKSICCCSFHQNKPYSYLSQILTIRSPFTMCIDAISACCCKYSPEGTHEHFPPASTFRPIRIALATGLSIINTLSTPSERFRSLQFRLRAVLNSYRPSMQLKTRFFSNRNQLDIASLLMPE